MFFTKKQLDLIKVIGETNPDGSLVDLDQILERLPHRPTKESLQFSLRALLKRGVLTRDKSEVRRGRRHRLIELTSQGIAEFAALSPSGSVTAGVAALSIEDDELAELFGET